MRPGNCSPSAAKAELFEGKGVEVECFHLPHGKARPALEKDSQQRASGYDRETTRILIEVLEGRERLGVFLDFVEHDEGRVGLDGDAGLQLEAGDENVDVVPGVEQLAHG